MGAFAPEIRFLSPEIIALLHREVAKMVGLNRGAGNRRYRWIESKSFVEDGPGSREGIRSFGNIGVGCSSFRSQPFGPFWRL